VPRVSLALMGLLSGLLGGLLGGCDAPPDARAQWLQTTLVLDNQVFLDTDPEQAQAKFARMSLSMYAFFRGTMPQFARDLTEGGGAGRGASRYATAETADVALVGDPHPENIGSFRGADGALVIDFNDFDAATYGPFHFDVRRLALGFHVAAEELGAGSPIAMAEAVVAGYVGEVGAMDAGRSAATAMAAGEDHGEILNYTLRKAAEDGAAREELDDYTRVLGARREMFFGEVEPAVDWEVGGHAMAVARDAVVPMSAAEMSDVAHLVGQWPATLVDAEVMAASAMAIKGASRRLGAGIASFAAPRFYVLLEGPTTALGDDVLLEIKRVYDPPPLPGFVRLPGRAFADNGARVVAMQRALQTTALGDPLLGSGNVGAASYRVRDRSKFQRGVDLAKIAEKLDEGDFAAEDLLVLAGQAGRLLARSHARAARQSGASGLLAISAALASEPEGFVTETVAFVGDYAPVLRGDYERFMAALAADGPALGYQTR
jgi:uncharacterized protein (DUF2252 family)